MTERQEAIVVEIEREEGCEDIALPVYQTDGSAGMDLRAAVREPLTLRRGAIALVPTGLRIALPPGYEAQVRPRSGLALRHGIIVPNAPGTIDADYRGPLNVILGNLGEADYTIRRGDRIGQLVLARVERIEWSLVERVGATERGDGGFGHTGVE